MELYTILFSLTIVPLLGYAIIKGNEISLVGYLSMKDRKMFELYLSNAPIIFLSCCIFEVAYLYQLKMDRLLFYYLIPFLYPISLILYLLLCNNVLQTKHFLLSLSSLSLVDIITKLFYLFWNDNKDSFNIMGLIVVIRLVFMASTSLRYAHEIQKEDYSKESGKNKDIFGQFLKIIKFFLPHYLKVLDRKHLISLTLFIASTIFQRAIVFYKPIYLKRAIDSVENTINNKGSRQTFWEDYYQAFLPFFATTFINGFGMIHEFHNGILSAIKEEIYISISTSTFNRINCLPYDFHIKNNCGEILSSLNDIAHRLESIVKYDLFGTVMDIIDYCIYLGVYYSTFGLTSLSILLCGTISRILVEYISLEKNKQIEKKGTNYRDTIGQIINDNVRGFDMVKMFVGEKHESNRYRQGLEGRESYFKGGKIRSSNSGSLSDTIKGLTFTICGSYCAYEVYNGTKTPGEFLYFTTFFNSIFYGLHRLTGIYRQLNYIVTSYEKLLEIMEIPLSFNINEPVAPLKPLKNCAIEFKNVSFSYPEKSTIIKDISFKLEKGKTLAIVSNSGNGKSTLVKLMSKFYAPTSGEIYINGEDISSLDERVVRSYLGIVSQTLSLFNETIKYNIKYGKPSATDEEIIEAAKMAHIHDMISSQPDGYDTKVGGSGLTLSGGEMQRLALARVFLKNAPIVILDEATSSLDNITEKKIQKTIKNLSNEKSVIIIAHRLTTVVHADTIICLKEGSICEYGTHSQLLDLKGEYYNLWNFNPEQVN